MPFLSCHFFVCLSQEDYSAWGRQGQNEFDEDKREPYYLEKQNVLSNNKFERSLIEGETKQCEKDSRPKFPRQMLIDILTS